MSVRVRESTQPDPPHRGRGKWLVVLVVLAALAIAMALFAIFHGTGDKDSGQGSSDGPASNTAVNDAEKPTANLSRATSSVAFAKTGFPHSQAGAVEAATELTEALGKMPSHRDSEVKEVAEALLPKTAADIMGTLPTARERSGLADDGTYPDLAMDERYYADLLPQFGAYKVEKHDDDAYTVSVWAPLVYGPGSPENLDEVQVLWNATKSDMVWKAGQWRVTADGAENFKKPLVPKDKNRPDVSYKERLSLLGDGWELYEGASETWPRDLLGPAPGEVQ